MDYNKIFIYTATFVPMVTRTRGVARISSRGGRAIHLQHVYIAFNYIYIYIYICV